MRRMARRWSFAGVARADRRTRVDGHDHGRSGAAPQADVGSPVELWGSQVPIDEVATRAGTVGYELMCALAPRVALETVN